MPTILCLMAVKEVLFRSYTCFVFADDVSISNLTIENTAGFGKTYGQTIALYAEGDALVFKKLRILSHQDSLFTGPLPFEEMQAGGFVGPTEFAPRIILHQYYEDCYIEGEVDFIFGLATAFLRTVPYLPWTAMKVHIMPITLPLQHIRIKSTVTSLILVN